MNLTKREFLNVLGAASVSGMALNAWDSADAATAGAALYDLPPFGNVSLLHMTDCHAQLLPVHFREPNVNLGVGDGNGRLPHLVGEHLLKAAGVPRGSALAHAYTHLDFTKAARQYGTVGGFAHLATLVKRLKASRPGALLLDGGDTWQGSATALWSGGKEMVDACRLLGVDVMTGHWEFTYGMQRVQQLIEQMKPRTAFLAQNVKTQDFGDPVFDPYVLREINGVSVAIIGQAFPYTPIANPRYMVADWRFGIQEEDLQKQVDEVRAKGAKAVVLLSHNGMDVDLKLASRVTGIDAILGGHTHDGVPVITTVSNRNGRTAVVNSGSNGKFLGVLDMDVGPSGLRDIRWRLLPIFSRLLPADAEMQAFITQSRAPHAAKLGEVLATTEGLLYRRGNFNGTGDQLILDALMAVQDCPIAFSPGFRWGTTLLPGQPIIREWLMDMTATTYSFATVTEMSGEMIKTVLEDVADNLFNPDPYYQQGGDMVRVGGLHYRCAPLEKAGQRISDMRLGGKPIEADKRYKVAGWAPVAENARTQNLKPVWDVVEQWLKAAPRSAPNRPARIQARVAQKPELVGMQGNRGMVAG